MRYRVIERVVFEYVWIVESDRALSRREIRANINGRGDGEAESRDEGSRTIRSVEVLP